MDDPPPASAPHIKGETNFPMIEINSSKALSPDDITVTLNVGGVKHETYVNTLKRFPGTRLGNPEALAVHFRPKLGDHFFDRHPLVFAAILNFYRTGVLHVPQDVCSAVVRGELEYWGIDEVNMEDCCWLGYSAQMDTDKLLTKFGIDKKSQLESLGTVPVPANTKLGRFRAAVWEGLENPFSSTAAKIYTFVSILVTLVSIFTFCAATHPAFSEKMTIRDYAKLYSVSPKAIAKDWKDTEYNYDFSNYNFDYLNNGYYYDYPDYNYTQSDSGSSYDQGVSGQSGSGNSSEQSVSLQSSSGNSSEEGVSVHLNASAMREGNTNTGDPPQQGSQRPPDTSADYNYDYDYDPDQSLPRRKKRSTLDDKIRFHLNTIFRLEGLKKMRSRRSISAAAMAVTNTTSNQSVHFHVNPTFHPPNIGLVITDYICYTYFSVEFLIRFTFCPNKLRFFATWVTWLDLACILPYYLEVVLDYVYKAEKYQETLVDALTALRIFRIFRILRLFRFNAGLRVLAFTLRSSLKEIFLMVLFLSTAVLFFGCLIYYADRSSGTFKSLPDAAWWAIVTMTTVGYGDIYPQTFVGRCVGSICAICGVLVIGFTVPVIVNNFMTFYAFVNANRMDLIRSKTPSDNQSNKVYPVPVISPIKG